MLYKKDIGSSSRNTRDFITVMGYARKKQNSLYRGYNPAIKNNVPRGCPRVRGLNWSVSLIPLCMFISSVCAGDQA